MKDLGGEDILFDGLLLLTGATFANESASGLPSCPDTLAGVTVWIGDEPQPLRYVSPDSVLVVPTRPTSWLIVRGFDGRIYYAPVRMAAVSPAIILAGSATNESETLTPLAMWRFGKYPPEILSPYGVPASRDGYPTVILIQGTGWRHASDVRATLGGVACPVLYAGSSNIFLGQDSLAIELPLALTQRGPLDLVVEAAGQRSNTARVWVRD